MVRRFLLLTAIVGIALLTGCSAHKVKDYKTSGFMLNYAGFEVGSEDQPNLVYVNPDASLGVYNKIIIDHIVVYFNREYVDNGIDSEQLAELSDYFNQSLTNALQDRYIIVTQPGEGVLRIRTAITGVVPGKPAANAASSIVPVGVAFSAIKKSTTGNNLAVGQASMEIELMDSLSGQRLAAAIDHREGGKGIVSSKWSATKEAFDHWAKNLRNFLDKQKAM